jgi:hypothetical protein
MRRILLLLIVLTLPACTLPRVPEVTDPSARVVGATLVEQTAEGAAFEVRVELTNPNDFALPVTIASYRVQVAGRSYSFTGKAGASMPPTGVQTLTLRGAVPTEGEDLAGEPYEVSGHVVYEKPGELRRVMVESGLPEPRLAFTGSGTIQ